MGHVDTRGALNFTPPELVRIVHEASRTGFQVHMHAVGDAAVRAGLDAFSANQKDLGRSDILHHIAHLCLVDDYDLQRFRDLNVVANIQPSWAYQDDNLSLITEPLLGPSRFAKLFPFSPLTNSGAMVVAGSDWPVSPLNPLEALEIAVSRKPVGVETVPPWIPEERMSIEKMLAAYTINAAYLSGEARLTGSIEIGKAADMIVLDRDLFATPVNRLHTAKVLSTRIASVGVMGHDLSPQDCQTIPRGVSLFSSAFAVGVFGAAGTQKH